MQSYSIDDYKRKIESYELSIFTVMNFIIDQYNNNNIPDERVEKIFNRFKQNKNNKFIQKETHLVIFEWAQRNAATIPSLPPLLSEINKLNEKRREEKDKIIELLKKERTLIQNEILTNESIENLTSNIQRAQKKLSSPFAAHRTIQISINKLEKDLKEYEEKLKAIHLKSTSKNHPFRIRTREELEKDLLAIEKEIRAYGGRVLSPKGGITIEEKLSSPKTMERDIKSSNKLTFSAESIIRERKKISLQNTRNDILYAGGMKKYLNNCKKMHKEVPEILLLKLEDVLNLLKNEYTSEIRTSSKLSALVELQKNMELVKKMIDETNKEIDKRKNFNIPKLSR